jgi:peroxiredoxin
MGEVQEGVSAKLPSPSGLISDKISRLMESIPPLKSSSARSSRALAAGMVALGILLLLAAAYVLLSNSASPAALGPARIGAPLANFSLNDLNGKPVQLSDYAGHPVLINAWATWCPPCQVEMPDLAAFYKAHQKDGLVILAVNAGETAAQAGAFARQYGLTFPVLLDSDEALMDAMHINDFPTSILVGRDGTVKAIHIGLLTPQMMDTEIAPYLN